MDKILELELKVTECRSELSKLNDLENADEGQLERMGVTDLKNTAALDTRLSAARVSAVDPKETRVENADDAEAKERRELRSIRCPATNYFREAAKGGKRCPGQRQNFRHLCGVDAGIPMDLFQAPEKRHEGQEGEKRAITPSPGTVGVNMAMVEPFVFAPSIASRAGNRNPGSAMFRHLCHARPLPRLHPRQPQKEKGWQPMPRLAR